MLTEKQRCVERGKLYFKHMEAMAPSKQVSLEASPDKIHLNLSMYNTHIHTFFVSTFFNYTKLLRRIYPSAK